MNDTGIKEVFLEEAREILEKLESDIVSLEERSDPEIINDIFRQVHTIKGSSGIAGFDQVYEFSHRLENLMDRVRSGELEADREIVNILLDGMDWIKMALFGGEEIGEEKLESVKRSLLEKIEGFEPEKAEEKPSGEAKKEEAASGGDEEEAGYRYFRVEARFREDIFLQGIDPLLVMEDLYSLGQVKAAHVNRGGMPEFESMDPEKCYLSWDLMLKTKKGLEDVMNVFLFVREDNPVKVEEVTSEFVKAADEKLMTDRKLGEILVGRGIITEEELAEAIDSQAKENRKLGDIVVEKGYATEKDVRYALGEQEKIRVKMETGTVRVDTTKLDRLMNLLGEIVIGQSSISRLADELDDEKSFRLKNALYGLDRTTREFQEQIMAIRMIPIGPTFEQFRRFVRDASQAAGKEIRLEIEGRETELDKTVIEKIGDPLKHMIRNAIDHGLETPEDRMAAGKDRAGTIRLRAYHQEGSVYIEIRDDGRGINKEKLRAKAIQKELIKAEDELSENKLLALIFVPGFSTADTVGDLSGRGVGMDVVKTNIDALRGVVEIESREGEGSVFRIKLPLTMAIIDGMLVRVGTQVYIVPLLSIVESMQPKREDVKTVEGKGEVLKVRDEYVTLVRLYDMFHIHADQANPWESLVVIVESGGDRVGIMVDDLLGQHQTVIKSLDKGITESRAVSGAAILGDGSVALIMDIHGLIGEIMG